MRRSPTFVAGSSRLGGIFDYATKSERLEEVTRELESPTVWDDPARAQELGRERARLHTIVHGIDTLTAGLNDAGDLLEMAIADSDDDTAQSVVADLARLEAQVGKLEFQRMFSGKMDSANAFVDIQAGAGGTESQDWAQMLLRMYLRWAESRGFKTEIIDLLEAEEAGIKNATVTVSGPYAYGYLRAEMGVHRLVRISPFDASKRRHTSFASVFVFPEISDDIDIKIEEKDLRIYTYRSGGHGGQHINVTDSAVRITHLPTGIVASCQNERSQHKNKAMAMKVLRSRLYDHYKRQQDEEMAKLEGEKAPIAWGSQIRSYVLAPYQLVKDHRTGEETGNVTAVLDGDVDRFIEAYLFKPPEQKAEDRRQSPQDQERR